MGDATDAVIEHGSTRTPAGRRSQLRFETDARCRSPTSRTPAYHLIPLRQYFIASIQFSSGCPYSCEFCDIPALYGRNPRLKTPAQVLAELDAHRGGGRHHRLLRGRQLHRATRRRRWSCCRTWSSGRRRNRFPLRFACEATLNIAQERAGARADARRRASYTVFCGIETPEPDALRAMSKDQNLRLPILEAVARI